MTERDQLFTGAIPQTYDTLMVPLIFEPYAEHLATQVAALAPRTVLETAAGSGALTRALMPRLDAQARCVATDLSQPMLDYAAKRQGADDRLTWWQADAQQLPFEDASFDLVCCQFGAMFFPDRVAAYGEVHRVLKPGGHWLFSVWDRIEENHFADDVTQAVATLFPEDPPRFLARTPHGYHDTAQIASDVRQAGFADLRIETRTAFSRAPTAGDAATAYCLGTPLRGEIEARDPGRLTPALAAATARIAGRCGSGPVVGQIRAHVITAVRG